MKLNKIIVKNFKGIAQASYDLSGSSASFEGANGVGKTTIADAIAWALFGKDSQGSGRPEVKPRKGGDPSVELHLDVDGRIVQIARKQKEKWSFKRGDAQKTFDGNVTEYAIDGEPVKAKEFDSFVADLAGKHFDLLTDPRAFLRMHWKEQREILQQLADIDRTGLISEFGDFGTGAALDASRTKAEKKARELAKELDQYPARIADVQACIGEPVKIDGKAASKAQVEADRLQDLIASARNGGRAMELQKQRTEIEAELGKWRTEKRRELTQRLELLEKERREMQKGVEAIQTERAQVAGEMKSTEADIKRHQAELETLRIQNVQIKQRIFDGLAACPACNRPFGADALADAEKAFNTQKAQDLEKNVTDGKAKKALIESLVGMREKFEAQEAALAEKITAQNKKIAAIQNEISGMEKSISEISDLVPESIAGKLKKLDVESAKPDDASGAIAELEAQLSAAREAVREFDRLYVQKEEQDKASARLNELLAAEKSTATARLEALEHADKIKAYTDALMKLTESAINEKFSYCKWSLFSATQEGTPIECCELEVEGAPGSTGQRLNAGIEIIKVLGKHWGEKPFIILDNAQDLQPLKIDIAELQLIEMRVSADPEIIFKKK